MARRVRSTLPGMLSARILPTLSCPTGPSTTLRAIDDGQVERARRWASPWKCSRARPSARARPSGIARGGSGAESPFRKARTSSRVDRGSPYGSFPARRGAVSVRGSSCGSTRGSPEIWRFETESNGAKSGRVKRQTTLGSAVHHFGCAEVILSRKRRDVRAIRRRRRPTFGVISLLSPLSLFLYLSLSLSLSFSLFLPLPFHFGTATISFSVTKWSEWFPEENPCRLCRNQLVQTAFQRFEKS